jgi:glutamate synthase (NADPH/NADH) large chain
MTKTELTTSTAIKQAEGIHADSKMSRTSLAERLGTAADKGLYNPSREHDACGVGFIAHMKGVKSHRDRRGWPAGSGEPHHRGAVGADPLMGDGAGMLVQIPHASSRKTLPLANRLPEFGGYGVGFIFLPQDDALRAKCEEIVEAGDPSRRQEPDRLARRAGRQPPFQGTGHCRDRAGVPPGLHPPRGRRRSGCLRTPALCAAQGDFQHVRAETDAVTKGFYIVSLSSRTIVYKGMFLAYQLGAYYADLKDERFTSALALVHQRFSTNTFPSWDLSHPYRMVAHNGEINTLRGNVNWMAARQASASSELLGDDISKLWPIPMRASRIPPASTMRSNSWSWAAIRWPTR